MGDWADEAEDNYFRALADGYCCELGEWCDIDHEKQNKRRKTKMTTATAGKKQRLATEVQTPEFRVSYPHVFEAAKAKPTDPKAFFSIQMIFRTAADPQKPNEKVVDINPLKAAAFAAATEKWGADRAKWPKNLNNPFRDGGTERADKDGYGPGTTFVGAKSEYKPGVVDQDVKDIMDRNLFYPGCYARAEVVAFGWEYMGKAGISFGLRHVQLIRDGAPLGGGTRAADAFEAIAVPGVAAKPAGAGPAPAAGGDLFGNLG